MICIFLGTRPEIIKLSPVIKLLIGTNKKFKIIHTNQHFSSNMDSDFFRSLEIPKPDFNLKVKERTNSAMVSEIIFKSVKVLEKIKPDVVLVQGDTNSVLGGAISSVKLRIPVGHVEAGLRSYDDSMPEEFNRRLTDHVSSFLFCPTRQQKNILLKEGISKHKIFITGNTIVDAVKNNLELVRENRTVLSKYLLLTVHRPSNVDDKATFMKIIRGIEVLSKKLKMNVVFPVHPRTKKKLSDFKIKLNKDVFKTLEPVGYLEMLNYQKDAQIILTDSGGVQEEACILNVPCVTIRDNTERPETVGVGANMLAGTNTDSIVKSSLQMFKAVRGWSNPYGDGTSAKKILNILDQNHLL